MTYPTLQQLARAADQVAQAELIHVENQVLKRGIKPTPEEMDKIRELAELAQQTGAPVGFLNAAAAITRKPMFFSCSCWWCRLKRMFRRI